MVGPKTIRKEDKAFGIIFIFLILGIGMVVGSAFFSAYTIYNDVDVQIQIWDVGDADGQAGDRLIQSEGDRVYDTMRVVIEPSHLDGIDHFTARLYIDENGDLGEKLKASKMTSYGGGKLAKEWSVNGYSTGYYWVKISGYSKTHKVTVDNPDWNSWNIRWKGKSNPQDSYVDPDTGKYIDVKFTEADNPHPTTKSIDVEDVAIQNPDPVKVYIQNPAVQIAFSLKAKHKASGAEINTGATLSDATRIEFYLDVGMGQIKDYTLKVYRGSKTTSDNKITGTMNLDTFYFETGAQADGLYTAKVWVTGKTGWIGGSSTFTFTLDNPDEVGGEVEVYRAVEEGWELVPEGGTLSGDIKVVVRNTVGNIASIWVRWFKDETESYSYEMYFDAGDMIWITVIDTTAIFNGDYSVQVEASREEDQITCILSSWDMGLAGAGTETARQTNYLIGALVGGIILTGIIYLVVLQNTGRIPKLKGRK